MASASGIAVIADYAGAAANKDRVQLLIDMIPDVDTNRTSGAQSGGGFLDEMGPAAAVQLRVELVALKAAITNAA